MQATRQLTYRPAVMQPAVMQPAVMQPAVMQPAVMQAIHYVHACRHACPASHSEPGIPTWPP